MDERDRRIAELESLLHAIRYELVVRGRLPAPVADKALGQIDAALHIGPSPVVALLADAVPGAAGARDETAALRAVAEAAPAVLDWANRVMIVYDPEDIARKKADMQRLHDALDALRAGGAGEGEAGDG